MTGVVRFKASNPRCWRAPPAPRVAAGGIKGLVSHTGPALSFRRMTEPLEVSIVMPCLNEAETLARCIENAKRGLHSAGVRGEIVVADNGSADGSR